MVSERAKLGVLCVLLLLAMVFTASTAENTFQSVRNLQLQNNGIRAGDIHTIRAWMTIHAISHIYHVPEDYVYRSLDISSTASFHRATLYEIASHKRQPLNKVIDTIQLAILTYRKRFDSFSMSTQQGSITKHLSPTLGRTEF